MKGAGDAAEGAGGRTNRTALVRRLGARRETWMRWPERHRRMVQGLLVLAVFLAGLTLLPRQEGYQRRAYELGTVLSKSVIAEFTFPINKDPEVLRQEQQAAKAAVPPVLVLQDSVAARALEGLERLGQAIEELRRPTTHETQPDEMEVPLSPSTYAVLLTEGPGLVLHTARQRLREHFERGILSEGLTRRLAGRERAALLVRGVDWVGPTERFVTPAELGRAREGSEDALAQAVAEVVARFAWPNVVFDQEETEARRGVAGDAIERSVGMVLKGEEIVGAHKRIWPEDLRALESYEYWRERRSAGLLEREQVLAHVGRALILVAALALMLLFLVSYWPHAVRALRDCLLLALLGALGLLLGGSTLQLLGLSAYLVPVGGLAVIITLLYDERLALVVSGFLAVSIGLVGDAGLDFVLITGGGAVAAVLSVRQLRDRRQFYRLLIFVPLAHLALLGVIALVRGMRLEALLADALYLVANPFLAAGIALIAVPAAESLFEKCTNLTLLELLDLNRPLLRRLMLEAPGTYHHSLMVGTLAEAGAARIGANPLLARVAGYYHDIGKLSKPDYFIENLMAGRRNPHDKLAPTMSRLILESHVRDGLVLARESRLPRVVRDAIAQHHATGLITYFYHKALKKDPLTAEMEYRYPGPLPQSREIAVLLLADQIDAASRSLEDPTPSRLRGLVKRIIERRALEGELDESALTLRDLAALREAFVPILTVLFHGRTSGRIVYPSLESPRANLAASARSEPTAPAERG